jgi:choline monooxygenase
MTTHPTIVPPAFLLPTEAYRSEEWLERERVALFDSGWRLVADASELARPGSFVAVDVSRSPLLLIRDSSGVLRAFQNMCRHRGIALASGCGTFAKDVACPYHAWRFELDGALKVVPQRSEQFPDLVLDEWGLLPAAVGEWEGMVFANPDVNATPLIDALGELPAHIGSYRPGLLREVARLDIEGAFNWKLFVENHIDVYHLWYLHAETLGDFDHTKFQHWQLGRNWASYEPLRRPDLAAAALTQGTAAIAHIDDRDRLGIGAHMVFPNLLMATAAEFFITYAVFPMTPGRSRIELRVRAEASANPAALVAAARSFIDEDVAACEQIQRLVGSPAFAVGPLARDHEASITTFHQHLLEAMQ